MSRIPANRVGVKLHEDPYHPGTYYRKLVKQSWGKLYRSCDEGLTWHRTSSEAFWHAFHTGKLTVMSPADVMFIQSGGIELA